MSSSAAQDDHDLAHEGPIKTPRQLVWTVVLAFVVPVIAIILLVNYVTSNKLPAAGSDGLSPEAVAKRLEKVGRVEIKDLSDPSSMKTSKPGARSRMARYAWSVLTSPTTTLMRGSRNASAAHFGSMSQPTRTVACGR